MFRSPQAKHREDVVGAEGTFILGDWGTSALRLWLVDADGFVLDRLQTTDGAGTLQGDAAGAVFSRVTQPWRAKHSPRIAILCGMVGRRGGWVEAPYLTPDRWSELPQHVAHLRLPDMDVRVVPGLRTRAADDVMRGEETQILGLTRHQPDFDGAICLPGTHTKWCQLAGGQIASFRTEMTGELFALLSRSSVLRDAVGPGFDDAAFDIATAEALNDPRAMGRLFGIRADWLLRDTDPAAGLSRLSGLLIGAEVARAIPDINGQNVALIGTGELTDKYARVLRFAGYDVQIQSGEEMAIAGLTSIANQMFELTDG
ncbi:hypothetical protein ACMU_05960 [Actibacterium mucosum KCTC 23349]|uniref:2-dehydro-3-deoxygalactonokinase n=1 Tax=Actibacterium mucosum KCTC 23349 TaxID=1454373 RepID=A0A037ZJ89_9RHOB|nr:2-dehydro-3-deoxygalactonokinase [Actibacterium mucosum]KAJ56485.1 hypothetical protein ACMU_05960 [Actibacterium mucosum KCTC 23349]